MKSKDAATDIMWLIDQIIVPASLKQPESNISKPEGKLFFFVRFLSLLHLSQLQIPIQRQL